MLKQRVITAIVLLLVFILALWSESGYLFIALTLLLIGAAGWEWSRLAGWSGQRAWASGALCALGAVVVPAVVLAVALADEVRVMVSHGIETQDALLASPLWKVVDAKENRAIFWYMAVAGVLWVVGGAWLLRRGVASWSVLPRWLRWGVGMVMLIVAWSALVWMWGMSTNYLLSCLAVAWVADSGAYFFGRALGGKFTGGRKLAPGISPGKSWEGAVGGLICVWLAGAIWVAVDRAWQLTDSLYTSLWQAGAAWFFGGLALLTAMSVVGDLTESLVKRAAGVKDSSALLPGHGGVLDRIDALLPLLPLALVVNGLAVAGWR